MKTILKSVIFLFFLLSLQACDDSSECPNCLSYTEESRLSSCPPSCAILASFEASDTIINAGSDLNFIDLSSGNPTEYSWIFQGGDPPTSTERNPNVTYKLEGTFDVELTVSNSKGKSTLLKEAYISVCEESCNSDSSLQETLGLVYGISPKYHQFNLYEYETSDSSKRPAILIFGGGGFQYASNLDYIKPIAESLARSGYVTATLRYRYEDVGNDPNRYNCAMLKAQQDTKAAVRYFRKNAAEFNIDPDKIIIGGNSSGAIAALMHAYLTEGDLSDDQIKIYEDCAGGVEGEQGNPGVSSIPNGVISISGLMYSSVNFIKSGKPPLYAVCSENDQVINCNESDPSDRGFITYGAIPMVERAKQQAVVSDIYIFPDGNHSTPRVNWSKYMPELLNWLEAI